MACKFFEMLDKRWDAGARVCVGLDSDTAKLPGELRAQGAILEFNTAIVEATKDYALAYKPNVAFYSSSWVYEEALSDTIAHIRHFAPKVPVILDAKRADMGNTNIGYIAEAFERYDADAVTVSPYFGMEAMKPFLDQKDKGIIVLCRTSNPGAGEFQDLLVVNPNPQLPSDMRATRPLYQFVAKCVAKHWNYNGNCALVVGATYPEELGKVRKIVGDDMWLLLPGIGKQGGDIEKAVLNGINSRKRGIVVNSSSGIIFASSGEDFAEAARRETEKLTAEINNALFAWQATS